ncbi:MAG TPA: metallophosphoesterase [Candidatus Methanomethylophilaceae archaeon]|nr:metallophosphoesterase [Candidatus Methanomethylophilaceae archaeon]
MRFLVITDFHQKRSKLELINSRIREYQPDFTLFLGDVTDMGTGEDAAGIIQDIDSKVYVIPGNCDPRDMPEKISNVAQDMHGKGAEIDGQYFAGLGGSNITIFGTPFELTEDELYKGLKPISKKGMILMTHVPSYGILDTIPSGQNVGSKSVRRIVEEFSPVVALSGHVHEAIGAVEKDGTLFVNPGPAREGYSAIIDIKDGKAEAILLGPRD